MPTPSLDLLRGSNAGTATLQTSIPATGTRVTDSPPAIRDREGLSNSLLPDKPLEAERSSATQASAQVVHATDTTSPENKHSSLTPLPGRQMQEEPCIHKLPVELLTYIFLEAIKEPDEPGGDTDPHSLRKSAMYRSRTPGSPNTRPLLSAWNTENPTVLGQVCRYWRDLALGIPALWSTIYIYYPMKTQVYLTKLWLKRSGDYCPLNLTMKEVEPEYPEDDQNAFREMMDAFTEPSRIRRWKKIDFQFPWDEGLCIRSFLSALQQDKMDFPVLESAALKFHDDENIGWAICDHPERPDEGIYLDEIWQLLHKAASLRSVNWDRLYEIIPDHPPWSQLTSIRIEEIGTFPIKILDALQYCENLQFLSVLSIQGYGEYRARSEESVIRHGMLHTLIIETRGSNEDQKSLFEIVELPALQTLTIGYVEDFKEPSFFQDFLVASQCHLKKLTLTHWRDSETDTGSILGNLLMLPELRSVVDLEVEEYRSYTVTNSTLRLLSQKDQNGLPKVMPNLEVLFLNVANCHSISDGLLAEMASCRHGSSKVQSGGKLKLITIVTDGSLYQYGPKDTAAFTTMFENGLKGSLRYRFLYQRRQEEEFLTAAYVKEVNTWIAMDAWDNVDSGEVKCT
ncbi:hypothetical protein BDZ97DRAFT_584848 [Flammula alnicola]|nr:hypothetical protein BDZ97DRAFT_584848 [Flammula alnicola]